VALDPDAPREGESAGRVVVRASHSEADFRLPVFFIAFHFFSGFDF